MSLHYSARKAICGLVREARNAGIYPAIAVTPINARAIAQYVIGSHGEVAYRSDAMRRAAAMDRVAPNTTPINASRRVPARTCFCTRAALAPSVPS